MNRAMRRQDASFVATDEELVERCKSFIVGQHPSLRLFPWLVRFVIPSDEELLAMLKPPTKEPK